MTRNPPTIRTVEEADRFVAQHPYKLRASGKWDYVSCAYQLSRIDASTCDTYIRAVREFAATLYPLQEEFLFRFSSVSFRIGG